MGVSLFGVVIMVFFLIQSSVFIGGVLRHSPDLMTEGFSLDLLSDPRMEERMNDLVCFLTENCCGGRPCTPAVLSSRR